MWTEKGEVAVSRLAAVRVPPLKAEARRHCIQAGEFSPYCLKIEHYQGKRLSQQDGHESGIARSPNDRSFWTVGFRDLHQDAFLN